MSDPFQLQVKVRTGPHANIMDVGYGISQSLPILVDLMHEEQSVFLLQQPEVHLHPRGQAQLASLFIESCKKRGNRFLVGLRFANPTQLANARRAAAANASANTSTSVGASSKSKRSSRSLNAPMA